MAARIGLRAMAALISVLSAGLAVVEVVANPRPASAPLQPQVARPSGESPGAYASGLDPSVQFADLSPVTSTYAS